MRGAVFVGPGVAFLVTRRVCASLQRADLDELRHGRESGVLVRATDGGYSERHLPPRGKVVHSRAAVREPEPLLESLPSSEGSQRPRPTRTDG
jgi:ubiquinol-cytochrome c reductase cytochrome b subunit